MARVDEKAAACFARLQAPEFQPVMTWLDAVYQETVEQLLVANATEVMRALQARAQFIKEFRELVTRSGDRQPKQ
jgi:hypothetical protein